MKNTMNISSFQRLRGLNFLAPLLFLLGILVLCPLSFHKQVGDVIFQWLGFMSWSPGGSTHWHTPIVLGWIFILFGMMLTIRLYQQSVPRIRSIMGWSMFLILGLFSVINNNF